jgi:hypothetical protein
MSRLQPKTATVKRLFALSGNQCTFSGCGQRMVSHEGVVLGEICHIEGAEPGGERYNPASDDEYRRSYDNLILFCSNHHKITNDILKYPSNRLKELKQSHENLFTAEPFEISDETANEAIQRMSQQNSNLVSGTQFNNQALHQTIGSQIGVQNVHNYSIDHPVVKIKDARPVNNEMKKIIDKEKQRATPPAKWVIDLKNELQERFERDVELIPTTHLKFRKANGRIKTDVESHEKLNSVELQEEVDTTQEILRGFLRKSDPEKNEKLKKQLYKKGQQYPAIITCDGFLINGNRRKMILEELFSENNQDPMYESMRVVILPENISELDIRKLENRYQMQDEGKSEYSGLNRALTLRDNIELNYDLRAQLSDDPEYSTLDKKEFEKKVREIETKFLRPLDCADRYLKLFGREKRYDTIHDKVGDKEGRWQAFIDYSSFYYNVLDKPAKRLEYKIAEHEVRKIENAIFKIIRKRSLLIKELETTIGKVHAFIRQLPKYIKNPEAKKFLLKIAEDAKEDLPADMKHDKEGKSFSERDVDDKWGNHYRKEILGNLVQAYRAVNNQQERDKPIELLEDALKKLKHDNMKVENMEVAYYEKAMELTQQIIYEADQIHKAVDHERYKYKQLLKKDKR